MEERIAVIGLGYVGLPIALAFARGFKAVIGFDVNAKRAERLRAGDGERDEVDRVARACETGVGAGTHRATSRRFVEAAKAVEHEHRDLTIELMNELALTCARSGLSTHDVLRRQGTKWNCVRFEPGLVGRHCIGV